MWKKDMEYGFDSYGSISRTGFPFPCFLDGKKFFYGVGRIVCESTGFCRKMPRCKIIRRLWHRQICGCSFRNSCVITLLFVMGTVISSSLTTPRIFQDLNLKGKMCGFMLIISAMMLPSAVTLIPQYQMWNRLHLLGTIAPLVVPAWFGGSAYFAFMLWRFFLNDSRELDERQWRWSRISEIL